MTLGRRESRATARLRARIAFVTSREWAGLTEDDRLVVGPLAEAGVAVAPAMWDDPELDWHGFDLAVVRSPWDYHTRAGEFAAWVERLERAGIPLLNPPRILRWNMDKRYLADLEARGVSVIATEWIPRGATIDLPRMLERCGWTRAVIKPAISGGAWRTRLTDPGRVKEDQSEAIAIAADTGLLVQRFVEEVRSAGEWSLVFFERCFSHAVVKRPVTGDFRVQRDFGGTAEPTAPSPALLESATRVLEAVPGPLLYARVDGVETQGTFELMELELIDPALFLGAVPRGARAFADAILGRLGLPAVVPPEAPAARG